MEIAVKHLCKSFGGRTVLRDLTFTAGPGITAVMAPSGTGRPSRSSRARAAAGS